MTISIDEFAAELCPLPTQPVIAVIAERTRVDAELVALIRRLGFYAVLHDLDSPEPQPGFAVVALTTSSARIATLTSIPAYRMATIVGIRPDRRADREDLVSPEGLRRLVTVLGDAGATHRQLRLGDKP